MEIKAVKFRKDGFYSQPFAFGGEEGPDKFDKNEFIRNHPTVYMGTHTPQGYENLEAKRVMDLDNPVPTVIAEVDLSEKKTSGKYVCSICGYVYDPAEHDGVAFEDLPDDWKCERCKQGKDKFNPA